MSSQVTITPDELLVVNPEKRPLYRSVLVSLLASS